MLMQSIRCLDNNVLVDSVWINGIFLYSSSQWKWNTFNFGTSV